MRKAGTYPKHNFFAMVSLYSHQLITMHNVHFATLKSSSKMTFLVPKNPFLTYKSIPSKIGVFYPLKNWHLFNCIKLRNFC